MLWGLLGFIITIGFLVTIHEYGHFWVARRCGVKIVRFSIGFGKPFLSWTGKKDGTKYTLAPIPLGGFVQMYGETDEEAVSEADKGRTFAAKKAWQRFLIAFAGPAVNLIFAVLAFSLLFMTGVQGIKPEVAHVSPQSLAYQAGLQSGDKLLSIDGHRIHLAVDAHIALAGAPHANVPVTYQRGEQTFQTQLNLTQLVAGDELQMQRTTGLFLADDYWPANVGKVLPNTAASAMGLHAGDRIIAIDGQQIAENDGLFKLSDTIAAKPNADVHLVVARGNERLQLSGKLGEREVNGKRYGFLGIEWQRVPNADFLKANRITERYGVLESLQQGTLKTAYYVKLTYDMFARLLRHEVSINNLGGPVTIGDAAGKSLQMGWSTFLNFLGLVSLSLAALNFLPIPMLDGGHMLFTVIEMIKGKPLSEKSMQLSMRLGQVVVFAFMGFVVLNDLWRYLG